MPLTLPVVARVGGLLLCLLEEPQLRSVGRILGENAILDKPGSRFALLGVGEVRAQQIIAGFPGPHPVRAGDFVGFHFGEFRSATVKGDGDGEPPKRAADLGFLAPRGVQNVT